MGLKCILSYNTILNTPMTHSSGPSKLSCFLGRKIAHINFDWLV